LSNGILDLKTFRAPEMPRGLTDCLGQAIQEGFISPLTTFLSRLIGLSAILVPLSLITYKHASMGSVTALVHNPPLLLTFGIVWLIAGLGIMLGHNFWSDGVLSVAVTLIGWLIFIRGISLVFASHLWQ
jgi:hypothetical protein